MHLSGRKAAEVYRPWWDVISRYLTVAEIALSAVLFYTIAGSEQEFVYLGGQESDNGTDGVFDDLGVRNGSSDLTDGLVRMVGEAKAGLEEMSVVRRAATIGGGSNAFTAGYVVAALACSSSLLLLDVAFTRLLYGHHLLQLACHVAGTLSDLREYRGAKRNGLLFTNALHHANDKRSLRLMFDSHNVARLILVFVLFVLTIHAVSGVTDDIRIQHVQHVMGIFLATVLSIQLCLVTFGAAWTHLNSRSLWGRLMATYSRTSDKLDVVRGRTVPSPPYYTNKSKRGGGSRVLESLNPYDSNLNLRLALDLVALHSGVGLALRCLTFLEGDVRDNWRPFRLEVGEEEDAETGGNSLMVSWKDPLAVLYLAPVPKELHLHYGLEITFQPTEEDQENSRESIVQIVGYDDIRYYRQMWRSAEPGSVELGSKEPLSYLEVFSDFPRDAALTVEVWTMIDGCLIAKSTAFYRGGDLCSPSSGSRLVPNAVPKPPRLPKGEDDEDERQDSTCSGEIGIEVQPPTEDESTSSAPEPRFEICPRRTSVSKKLVLTPAVSSVFGTKEESEEEEEGKEEKYAEAGDDGEGEGEADSEDAEAGRASRSMNDLSAEKTRPQRGKMKKSQSHGTTRTMLRLSGRSSSMDDEEGLVEDEEERPKGDKRRGSLNLVRSKKKHHQQNKEGRDNKAFETYEDDTQYII